MTFIREDLINWDSKGFSPSSPYTENVDRFAPLARLVIAALTGLCSYRIERQLRKEKKRRVLLFP